MCQIDENGIFYLDVYYPPFNKWFGIPYYYLFKDRKEILKLNERAPEIINYFANKIIKEFDFFFKKNDTGIAVVPPTDPQKRDSGIKDIAIYIANFLSIVDGTNCLNRIKRIQKHVNGRSITIIDSTLVEGKSYLLLDDVTISGNSLLACKEVLETAGAKEVICVALMKDFLIPLFYHI